MYKPEWPPCIPICEYFFDQFQQKRFFVLYVQLFYKFEI